MVFMVRIESNQEERTLITPIQYRPHRCAQPFRAAPDTVGTAAIVPLESTRDPSIGMYGLANVSPASFCMPRDVDTKSQTLLDLAIPYNEGNNTPHQT
jgi:hypothetical protein